MKVNSIQNLIPLEKIQQTPKSESTSIDFKNTLMDALNKVEAAQKESEIKTNQLITGEITDIHQVMIAAQKASLSLQLTVQVRNKVVESYQEIMRMQV
ncbi:flagellar hook-basal body complex protein FliE [Caldalkalibacillus mannanilyticus]|uniref:flagellar hook-basal body complex protein FliE n=1 Tax=Caldalkalibacillus mannanilyticus TaxID=1418 RepID=UPI00054EDED2